MSRLPTTLRSDADRAEAVAYAKAFWALVEADPVVRYAAIAGVALFWLAIALANVWLLAALPFVAWGAVLLRRYRRRAGVGVGDDLEDLL